MYVCAFCIFSPLSAIIITAYLIHVFPSLHTSYNNIASSSIRYTKYRRQFGGTLSVFISMQRDGIEFNDSERDGREGERKCLFLSLSWHSAGLTAGKRAGRASCAWIRAWSRKMRRGTMENRVEGGGAFTVSTYEPIFREVCRWTGFPGPFPQPRLASSLSLSLSFFHSHRRHPPPGATLTFSFIDYLLPVNPLARFFCSSPSSEHVYGRR